MPERIQRKRTKGWRMPENAVYVGRPTKWFNPFALGSLAPAVGPDGPAICVASYRRWATAEYKRAAAEELRGKDLACWCPLVVPCHADVLLAWANADVP